MSLPNVSVVIPSYNSSKTLFRTVLSAIRQSVKPFELIIVDDASSEPVLEDFYSIYELAIKHNIGVVLVQNNKNRGPSYCRNLGRKMASGAFIAFLDADDEWCTNKLESQLLYMSKNPTVGLTGHEVRYKGDEDLGCQSLRIDDVAFFNVSVRQGLIKNVLRSTSTFMIRSDLNVWFDSSKRFSEDYKFFLEVLFSEKKVAFSNVYLTQSHKKPFGDKGLSSQLFKMEKGELENYLFLYRKGWISVLGFLLVVFFSTLKFVRRVILSYLNRVG